MLRERLTRATDLTSAEIEKLVKYAEELPGSALVERVASGSDSDVRALVQEHRDRGFFDEAPAADEQPDPENTNAQQPSARDEPEPEPIGDGDAPQPTDGPDALEVDPSSGTKPRRKPS